LQSKGVVLKTREIRTKNLNVACEVTPVEIDDCGPGNELNISFVYLKDTAKLGTKLC